MTDDVALTGIRAFIALLAAAVVVALVTRRIRVPFTVSLVLFGLAVGSSDRVPDWQRESAKAGARVLARWLLPAFGRKHHLVTSGLHDALIVSEVEPKCPDDPG
jgi:Kef-type K+ transport system membrane component KefB